MKNHRSQCLAIAVSIATAAFAVAESKPAAAKGPGGLSVEIAATVNGEAITNAELEQAFERAAKSRNMSVDAVPPEQRAGVMRMILDDMINERLVTKAASKVKVEPAAVDAEFEKIREARKATVEDVKKELAGMGMTIESLKADIAKRMQQRQWVDDQIKGKAADPTESDSKEFYQKNPQHFEQPEQVRASHILFRLTPDASPEKVTEALKKAETAVTRAKKEDFGKLAGELSEEPGAKERGGDLSFFPRKGAMVEPFAEAAFKLKKDEVSAEPVRSEFGYHVIKVTDRKEPSKQAFEEAKPQIVAFLSREKKRVAIDSMIAEMRQKAEVKLNIAAPEAPAPAPVPAQPAPKK
ncbi:MAG: peptidylprolyl isomerase [Chthoniobacteraceae bacterium]